MNGETENYYLGVLTLSEEECANHSKLLGYLLQNEANCAIIFSKAKKTSEIRHYTVCWVHGSNRNTLAYYDPMEHFEGPCRVSPDIAYRAFMHSKIGIILGKGIKDR